MFKRILINMAVRNRQFIICNKNIHFTSKVTLISSSQSNCIEATCCCVPSKYVPKYRRFKYNQTRLYSCSSFPDSIVHKILFVSAASPIGDEPHTEGSEHIGAEDDKGLYFSGIEGLDSTSDSVDEAITYIPPPPAPPEVLDPPLNALGEPTLSSLGLGGWSPVGLLQHVIEFFHVSLDIPWWSAIAITTLLLRLMVSPLVILSQRHAAKMANCMPKIQELQRKMTDARLSGNNLEAAKVAYELQEVMKKEDIKPLQSAILPMAQAPIFISMFLGLRRCVNLPVESFQTGGMLWFTDLTLTDPYFLLPVITSLTLLATIEVGSDGRPMVGPNAVMVRYILRALPVIIFPFIMNFPSAILCYWVSTNFFSLGQVAVLRLPAVRQYFRIEALKQQAPVKKKDKKGFVTNIKEAYSNMKITSEVKERQRVDAIAFQKAGIGRPVKTFKHNPLEKKNVINVKALNVKTHPKNG